jgi:GAF domain-containing protein
VSDETPDASPPRPDDLPAVSRLAAGNGLRERLKNRAGLGPIAAGAASFLHDFFEADAAAISILKGDWYRTLYTEGPPTPGQQRHSDGATYPVSDYPTVTRLLRSGSGYVSSIGNPGGVPESQRFLTDWRKSTCMGAPIAYGGETVGEAFVSREKGRAHYTGHDLAALLDLARQIGYRIGPAIKAQDALDTSWWPESQDGEAPADGQPPA